MKSTELIVIGGFLGSGKTTSILDISKRLIGQGKKVGIVTNDQGSDLVDTNFLQKSGLSVFEVTGGCFCCNFDEFTKKVAELSGSLLPDVILAEPVGSCTDLVAAILKPVNASSMKNLYLGPLSVAADPKRVKKLMMEGNSPFPSEINYLFKKQLEEADIIVLNKTDTISQTEVETILSFLKDNFKGTEVIAVSAKEGTGIENWMSILKSRTYIERPSLDIDYNAYAKAEEDLGWLNGTVHACSNAPHDANEFIQCLMEGIREKLVSMTLEIAHLKIYEICNGDFAKASITSNDEHINFNKRMENNVSDANLVINARVSAPPEILKPIVENSLKNIAQKRNIGLEGLSISCFKPSRPKPKYRL